MPACPRAEGAPRKATKQVQLDGAPPPRLSLGSAGFNSWTAGPSGDVRARAAPRGTGTRRGTTVHKMHTLGSPRAGQGQEEESAVKLSRRRSPICEDMHANRVEIHPSPPKPQLVQHARILRVTPHEKPETRNRSTGQPIIQPADRPTDRPADRPADLSTTDRLIERPTEAAER